MPVHVEEVTSEVTVADGQLPLSDAQLERLVALVASRLEQRRRAASQTRDATALRHGAEPPSGIGGVS
jgi:hypothetical protein